SSKRTIAKRSSSLRRRSPRRDSAARSRSVLSGRTGSDESRAVFPSILSNGRRRTAMGSIKVHEFTSLDGVIDAPSWTAEFGFDPRMGEAIAGAMAGCDAILLGRTTFE